MLQFGREGVAKQRCVLSETKGAVTGAGYDAFSVHAHCRSPDYPPSHAPLRCRCSRGPRRSTNGNLPATQATQGPEILYTTRANAHRYSDDLAEEAFYSYPKHKCFADDDGRRVAP